MGTKTPEKRFEKRIKKFVKDNKERLRDCETRLTFRVRMAEDVSFAEEYMSQYRSEIRCDLGEVRVVHAPRSIEAEPWVSTFQTRIDDAVADLNRKVEEDGKGSVGSVTSPSVPIWVRVGEKQKLLDALPDGYTIREMADPGYYRIYVSGTQPGWTEEEEDKARGEFC